MANNYTLTSAMLKVSADKLELAKSVCEDAELELSDSMDEPCGINWEVEDKGIWFHHDESANIEHLEFMARAVMEALEIDEPFYCSWAYICSKPRIDEFGGGAFAIVRGYDTVWVDARSLVEQQVSEGGLV